MNFIPYLDRNRVTKERKGGDCPNMIFIVLYNKKNIFKLVRIERKNTCLPQPFIILKGSESFSLHVLLKHKHSKTLLSYHTNNKLSFVS